VEEFAEGIATKTSGQMSHTVWKHWLTEPL